MPETIDIEFGFGYDAAFLKSYSGDKNKAEKVVRELVGQANNALGEENIKPKVRIIVKELLYIDAEYNSMDEIEEDGKFIDLKRQFTR